MDHFYFNDIFDKYEQLKGNITKKLINGEVSKAGYMLLSIEQYKFTEWFARLLWVNIITFKL